MLQRIFFSLVIFLLSSYSLVKAQTPGSAINPYEHGVKLTKALRDAGDDAELVSVPQGHHGFPKATEDEIYEHDIWPFLKKHGVMP